MSPSHSQLMPTTLSVTHSRTHRDDATIYANTNSSNDINAIQRVHYDGHDNEDPIRKTF